MTAKQRQMLITYGLFAVLIAAIVAVLLTIFPVRAQAQSAVRNSGKITQLCRLKSTDAFGCAMLRNTFELSGLIPPSIIRYTTSSLYSVKERGRDASTRTKADLLYDRWLDELEIKMNVRNVIVLNNSGLLIEEGWLVRLNGCAQNPGKPCRMLKDVKLLADTLQFMQSVRPANQRVWNMFREASTLMGNPA